MKKDALLSCLRWGMLTAGRGCSRQWLASAGYVFRHVYLDEIPPRPPRHRHQQRVHAHHINERL